MANPVDVWSQMGYVPPRGQCNYKQTVLSQKCPCLRFMLHPLKSSSSYECDGCSHHASFHNLENKMEDDIRKRWEQEAKDKAEQESLVPRSKKRIRAIEDKNGATAQSLQSTTLLASTSISRGGGGTRRPGRAAGARAKGRVTEIVEDEEDTVVELD